MEHTYYIYLDKEKRSFWFASKPYSSDRYQALYSVTGFLKALEAAKSLNAEYSTIISSAEEYLEKLKDDTLDNIVDKVMEEHPEWFI